MTTAVINQEEVLGKIYRDFARLAGEIAIDRCRNRVLLKLVKDQLNMDDDKLNQLFQAELEANLEQFCNDITGPMLAELSEPEEITLGGGGCGGGCACAG
jgi:hypothetical protein